MDLGKFVDRYNDLTSLFLQKFDEEAQDKNIVFSPFSIISLLSILSDATDGATSREVQNLLYGNLPYQGFPEQLKTVREKLTRKEDYSSWLDYEDPYHGKPILDRNEHLNTANAIFIIEKYVFVIKLLKDCIWDDYSSHVCVYIKGDRT